MGVAKFTQVGNNSGTVQIINNTVATVKIRFEGVINDDPESDGYALNSFSATYAGETKSMSFSSEEENKDISFNVDVASKGGTISVSWSSLDPPNKQGEDRELCFKDTLKDDCNGLIKLRDTGTTYYDGTPPTTDTGGITPEGEDPPEPVSIGPSSCPAVRPWSDFLPNCASAPTKIDTVGGLLLEKKSESSVAINLKNYENKLVTLKIVHEVNSSWTNGLNFDIPYCSDTEPELGGEPYSKSGFSNGAMVGTNTFYLYNLDGGDYDYVFNSSSVAGARPTRTNYIFRSESCGENCTRNWCEEFTERYEGTWPHCPVGVAISKSGGTEVRWVYEDGHGDKSSTKGVGYTQQIVTVTLVGVRDCIPATKEVCSADLRNNVWVPDALDSEADGKCISDYKDYSSKIRFRIPSARTSLTSIPEPVYFSKFRLVSGAASPTDQLVLPPNTYGVYHSFDKDEYTTISLVDSAGITVVPKNETYLGGGVADSETQPYYEVTFNDTSFELTANLSNLDVSVTQGVTADGIEASITASKLERVSTNVFNVWFYKTNSYLSDVIDQISHSFDDDEKTTISLEREDDDVLDIVTVSEDDDGTAALNAEERRHYRVTFKDDTEIEDGSASNIRCWSLANRTAGGELFPLIATRQVRVSSNTMDVWFTCYDPDNLRNDFPETWFIGRDITEPSNDNTFVKYWNIEVTR